MKNKFALLLLSLTALSQQSCEFSSTPISQSYANRRSMSKAEAERILGTFLESTRPTVELPKVGYASPDTHRFFGSISESGYTMLIYEPIWDTPKPDIVRPFHYGAGGVYQVRFANVDRIIVSLNSTVPDYSAIRIIDNKGKCLDSYGFHKHKTYVRRIGPISESEILSALLTLCPNVK